MCPLFNSMCPLFNTPALSVSSFSLSLSLSREEKRKRRRKFLERVGILPHSPLGGAVLSPIP